MNINIKNKIIALELVIIFVLILYLLLSNLSLMKVKSESMSPEINTGDLILVYKLNKLEYSINSTIVFYNPFEEKRTVHKIVRKEEGRYITKGINNEFEDIYKLNPKNIIGKPILIIK